MGAERTELARRTCAATDSIGSCVLISTQAIDTYSDTNTTKPHPPPTQPPTQPPASAMSQVACGEERRFRARAVYPAHPPPLPASSPSLRRPPSWPQQQRPARNGAGLRGTRWVRARHAARARSRPSLQPPPLARPSKPRGHAALTALSSFSLRPYTSMLMSCLTLSSSFTTFTMFITRLSSRLKLKPLRVPPRGTRSLRAAARAAARACGPSHGLCSAGARAQGSGQRWLRLDAMPQAPMLPATKAGWGVQPGCARLPARPPPHPHEVVLRVRPHPRPCRGLTPRLPVLAVPRCLHLRWQRCLVPADGRAVRHASHRLVRRARACCCSRRVPHAGRQLCEAWAEEGWMCGCWQADGAAAGAAGAGRHMPARAAAPMARHSMLVAFTGSRIIRSCSLPPSWLFSKQWARPCGWAGTGVGRAQPRAGAGACCHGLPRPCSTTLGCQMLAGCGCRRPVSCNPSRCGAASRSPPPCSSRCPGCRRTSGPPRLPSWHGRGGQWGRQCGRVQAKGRLLLACCRVLCCSCWRPWWQGWIWGLMASRQCERHAKGRGAEPAAAAVARSAHHQRGRHWVNGRSLSSPRARTHVTRQRGAARKPTNNPRTHTHVTCRPVSVAPLAPTPRPRARRPCPSASPAAGGAPTRAGSCVQRGLGQGRCIRWMRHRAGRAARLGTVGCCSWGVQRRAALEALARLAGPRCCQPTQAAAAPRSPPSPQRPHNHHQQRRGKAAWPAGCQKGPPRGPPRGRPPPHHNGCCTRPLPIRCPCCSCQPHAQPCCSWAAG